MMEKWWEALSPSPEASHVISFLDSQTQRKMIKQSRTETKKAAIGQESHAEREQKFQCHGFVQTK